MKKTLALLCAVVLCLGLFCGCSAKQADLGKVLDDINASCDTSGLTKITDVNDLKTYYQIEPADVKQFAAEINMNSSTAPVEIVLVEAVDSSAAQRVSDCLSNRYNAIYNMYASYSADQLAIIKNCSVTTDGNYVSMIVAEDASKMLDIYNKAIK